MNRLNRGWCNACQAKAERYYTSLSEERLSGLGLLGDCKAGVMRDGH